MCNAFHEVTDLVRKDDSKCTIVVRWINDLKGAPSVENDVNHGYGPLSVNIKGPVAKNSAENDKISIRDIVRKEIHVTPMLDRSRRK